MKINKLTRRMFLQGSGGALVAIPFLESLLPVTAWAQSTAAPRRFISILSSYDYGHHSNWIPGSSGSNAFNIPLPNRTLSLNGETVAWQPLREFAPTNSSFLATIYGAEFSAYLDSMNIFRSLDHIDPRGHDGSRVLGGVEDAHPGIGGLPHIPTIDHLINAKIGNGLPVIFGGGAGSVGQWSIAPTPTGAIRATSVGPWATSLYNSIFRNGTYPETGTVNNSTSRRDVLTRVLGDFNRVMNSRNISSADKVTLSNAMDVMSDVQKQISTVATSQCSYKNIQPSPDYGYWQASDPVFGKAFANLITAALMCDAVRTLTFGVDPYSEVYKGEVFDHQITSHQPYQVHAGSGLKEWQLMGERHALTFKNFIAPLVKNLSSSLDSNGKSILYNSIVFCSSEGSLVHGTQSHPAITFGNAGGTFKSGNYIDYANRALGPSQGNDLGNLTVGDPMFTNNWYGVNYNRLMTTFLQAFGMTPGEYENSLLQKELTNRTDLGAQNANLAAIGGYGYAVAEDFSILDANNMNYYKQLISKYDLSKFKNKLVIP